MTCVAQRTRCNAEQQHSRRHPARHSADSLVVRWKARTAHNACSIAEGAAPARRAALRASKLQRICQASLHSYLPRGALHFFSERQQAMHVTFVRHGESTGNAGVPCFDLSKLELTALGYAQAAQVAQDWQQAPALVALSPYLRTHQTALATIERFPSVPTRVLPMEEFTYWSPAAGTVQRVAAACRISRPIGHKPIPITKMAPVQKALPL